MPIYRDKKAGCWRFEFNRVIKGVGRVRARKRLPRSWDRAKADAYDIEETGKLYARAKGTDQPEAGIEEALSLYIGERIPELKHGARQVQEMALCYWAFRGKPLAALPEVCSAIRKEWAGVLAPATIRNRIRYLTAACRWAWKHHALCEHNPAERVAVPEVNNERQVYTDRAHMLLLAMTARDCRETRALIRLGFYTGMRLGEIFAAEPDHARGLMKLPDTKNGEPRWIPVPGRARAAMRLLPFTLTRSTLEKRWRSVRGAVQLDHLHFHDLRHSTASEMVNAGVDLYTIGKVLGHKSPQSTQRYAHVETDTLAAALAKVGRRVA
jgi:integrase